MEIKVPPKISNLTAMMIISTAVVVDLVQWGIGLFAVGIITIPIVWIVNGFINIIAWLTFYLWFSSHGVSFISPKKAITMAAAVLGDTLVGGYLPAWIICVVMIISLEKAEGLLAHAPGGETALKMAKMKAGGKPTPLPSGPKSAPKGPPPIPKGPPPLPPRPGETGYGEPVSARTYNLKQGVEEFQRKAKSSAEERAEGLRRHAERYREEIEEEIKDYGAGVREGQRYIKE